MMTFFLSQKRLNWLCVAAVLLCGFLCNPSTSLAKGGGLDGGGNGVFLQSAHSQNLVFWDLYMVNPNFADNQRGDQIQFKNPWASFREGRQSQGEWIDYREFKSFEFLKSRLALWKNRASNLSDLLNDKIGFAGEGQNNYRLLLIGTPLFVQKLDEIQVPTNIDVSQVSAFPGAYFDGTSGKIYLNSTLWNRTGLISQAAMLLHERMRILQTRFSLTNEKLQRVVSHILLDDPASVAAQDYNDNDFSKSAVLINGHSQGTINHINPVALEGFDAYFHGGIFDCLKQAESLACVTKMVSSLSPNYSIPANMDLTFFVVADSEAEAIAAKGFLGEKNPGALKLVSTGTQNTELPLPTYELPFERMFGAYEVVSCQEFIKSSDAWLNFCNYGFFDISSPESMTTPTSILVFKNGSGGFATVGAFNKNIKTIGAGFVYQEDGNRLASVTQKMNSDMLNIDTETSLTKIEDGKYRLRLKSLMKHKNADLNKDLTNYNFEMILIKK